MDPQALREAVQAAPQVAETVLASIVIIPLALLMAIPFILGE